MFSHLVQLVPREAENPTAHNSGFVYISRTPFDGRVPTAVESMRRSGVWEIHGSFWTPTSLPGVSGRLPL